jgi:hypothetical protein
MKKGTSQKKARVGGPLFETPIDRLALGKLGATTRLAQSDFFSFYLSRVARDVPCSPQRSAKTFVVIEQSAR